MNRELPPPRPTALHEIGPLLLAWQLYFHVRAHLSLWCIYEALHSCFSGSNTHTFSIWFMPPPSPPLFAVILSPLCYQPCYFSLLNGIKHFLTFSWPINPNIDLALCALCLSSCSARWFSTCNNWVSGVMFKCRTRQGWEVELRLV